MGKRTGPRSSNTWRDVMQAADKLQDKTAHELARLFRDMMSHHGIGITAFDNLADRYYRKIYTNRHGVVDVIKVNQEKSNLTRALAKDSLPFFRFVTVLKILGPVSYIITVTMKHADGHTYKHSVETMNRFAILPAIEDEAEPEEVPKERLSVRAKIQQKKDEKKK